MIISAESRSARSPGVGRRRRRSAPPAPGGLDSAEIRLPAALPRIPRFARQNSTLLFPSLRATRAITSSTTSGRPPPARPAAARPLGRPPARRRPQAEGRPRARPAPAARRPLGSRAGARDHEGAPRAAAAARPRCGRGAVGLHGAGARPLRLPAVRVLDPGRPPAPDRRSRRPPRAGARRAWPLGAMRAEAQPPLEPQGHRVRGPLPRPRPAHAARSAARALLRAQQRPSPQRRLAALWCPSPRRLAALWGFRARASRARSVLLRALVRRLSPTPTNAAAVRSLPDRRRSHLAPDHGLAPARRDRPRRDPGATTAITLRERSVQSTAGYFAAGSSFWRWLRSASTTSSCMPWPPSRS